MLFHGRLPLMLRQVCAFLICHLTCKHIVCCLLYQIGVFCSLYSLSGVIFLQHMQYSMLVCVVCQKERSDVIDVMCLHISTMF